MVTVVPSSVRLRAYQVGFGDCLLLTVTYAAPLPDGRTERHVLVDFGTKSKAEGGPSMTELATLIVEHCGGRLDAVVVTHRHADHVSGFGGQKAAAELAPLQPGLIIRPWPDGPADLDVGGQNLDAESKRFLALLDDVGSLNAAAVESFGIDGRTTSGRVGRLASFDVANQDALDMLGSWTTPDPTVWVRADQTVDTDNLLPEVGIRVLGPPTLENEPDLTRYASTSSDYWLQMTREGLIAPVLRPADADEVRESCETVAAPGGLGSAAWLVEKMRRAGTRQAMEIVAGFDAVLNNTSVILLVTVADRSLLLAGDAQVENWSWTLDHALGQNNKEPDPELRRALTEVDLYKVGHHGSRNASPKRLVSLWQQDRGGRELCSVLSTKHGVFDETVEGTVPKQELIDALEALGPVRNTDGLPSGVWWFDVRTSAQGAPTRWEYAEGPSMLG